MHLRHSILKRVLPLLDENRQRRLKYVFEHHIPRQNRRYRKIVRRIRRKGQVNVLFIASSLPMWRFDELYRLMKRDSRMNVGICIRPFAKYRGEEYEKCRNALTDHFKSEQFDFECIEEPSAFDALRLTSSPTSYSPPSRTTDATTTPWNGGIILTACLFTCPTG